MPRFTCLGEKRSTERDWRCTCDVSFKLSTSTDAISRVRRHGVGMPHKKREVYCDRNFRANPNFTCSVEFPFNVNCTLTGYLIMVGRLITFGSFAPVCKRDPR